MKLVINDKELQRQIYIPPFRVETFADGPKVVTRFDVPISHLIDAQGKTAQEVCKELNDSIKRTTFK